MAINPTKIADVIQPELFAQYVIDKTTEKSELMFAGAIENNPVLNRLITGGGTVFTMPKWNDLEGKSEVLSDQHPISVDKITSHAELATMLIRAKAWGANELAGALAGDDPMKAIASLVSNWWVRDEKSNVMAILNGIFSSASMSDLILDVSGTANPTINSTSVLDAKQLLGDASDLLTMMYVNSATRTELQKQNVIEYIPTSESHVRIETYLGYRLVVDDSCPVDTSGSTPVYTTYLLSRGCIQRGIGVPVSITPVETDRDSLASEDYLINRQSKVLHPKGISWIGAANIVDATPTDVELATGTNWNRVAEKKKIGIVKLIHTL